MKKKLLLLAALVLMAPIFVNAEVTPGACGCMDVVFVVDDTGSMGPAIDNIKTGLATIVGTAQTASGNDLFSGLVSFKDDVNVRQGFVDSSVDATTITNAINALVASGGAGTPESSDEAVKYVAIGATACTLINPPLGTFRDGCGKIAVLVTDALPGGCNDIYTAGVDDVAAAAAADAAAAGGILVSAIHVNDGFQFATEQPIMTYYAAATGGQYVEVPASGEGAADAINDIIAKCGTSSNRCPRSQGFWKTHSDAWPVDSLAIGGTLYSGEQLLAVLNKPVQGNAVLILAKQLIAAELNIANGSDPTPIAAARADAHALLTGVDITSDVVRTNTTTGKSMTSTAGVLDTYNNRLLTTSCENGSDES